MDALVVVLRVEMGPVAGFILAGVADDGCAFLLLVRLVLGLVDFAGVEEANFDPGFPGNFFVFAEVFAGGEVASASGAGGVT